MDFTIIFGHSSEEVTFLVPPFVGVKGCWLRTLTLVSSLDMINMFFRNISLEELGSLSVSGILCC